MNFRLTAVLFAAVLAVVVGLLVYSQLESDPAADNSLVPKFAEGLKEADVDTVEIARTQPAEGKLVFARTGPANWELRQPATARVEGFAVESLVKAVFAAKPTRYPGLTGNLTTHGLAAATLTVTLKSKGERSVSVSLGDTTIGGADATTFAVTTERPGVPVALRTADLRPLFRDGQTAAEGPAAGKAKWLGEFRTKRLAGVDGVNPGSDLAAFKLTQGGQTLALTRTPEGGWRFDQPAGFGDADTAGDTAPRTDVFTGVRPLLTLLTNLQAAGPADFVESPSAGELAGYGLADNDPAALRVEFKPKGNAPAEVLWIGKPVDGAAPPRVWCRREGDPAAVKVAIERLPLVAATIKNPGELRNRDFLAEGRKPEIDALDVTVKGETFRLRRTGTGPAVAWKVFGGPGPRDADRFAVQALLDALAKPRAAKAILPAPNPNAFNAPEIQGEVKIWFNGVDAAPPPAGQAALDEPKLKGGPDASFTIGRVDADGSFFRRVAKADTTDYKIAADLVAALTKPRLDYVTVAVAPFSPFAATNLVLARGADTTEVKKVSPPADADARWEYVRPTAGPLADAPAIGRVLESLGTYQPRKVVADAPTPDDLKKWGLDPAAPRFKATVTVAGLDKPREFAVGNETDDKASVYIKATDGPFVTLAPKALADELAAADFRDRVAIRVDPAKAVKIVLHGWKAPAAKDPMHVTLEKKDGKWVSDQPGFVPDDAKVNGLLAALHAPRLTEFVKELNPAAQGLTAEHGSLLIFVTEQGAPEVSIDLGSKEEPGKPGLVATSSGQKGLVFRVDAAAFKKYVDDPKSLQK